SKITQVVVRHEQGAAFMADVAGRLTSYPGVCLATLGPGATNLLTGVADATLDGAPLVALTGQAGLERIHKRSHQYVDVLAMFAPVAKTRIPATHTFMAKGALDDRDAATLPAVGLQRPGADLAALPELAQADVVVCVGYDLVEWAPALWNPKGDKRVVHVDSRPAEI